MKLKFHEMKSASVTVPGELYDKLAVGSMTIKYWTNEYILILVNPDTIEAIRTRPPKIERGELPRTLLGFPVIEKPSRPYYDEEVYQFYLSAQFEEYALLYVQKEEES